MVVVVVLTLSGVLPGREPEGRRGRGKREVLCRESALLIDLRTCTRARLGWMVCTRE